MSKKTKDRGHMYKRVEHCPREKAFADTWEKENELQPGTNFGQGILQDLFMSESGAFFGFRSPIHWVTPKERWIAATVVQWLGTNCGMCFLDEVFRKCGYRLVQIGSEREWRIVAAAKAQSTKRHKRWTMENSIAALTEELAELKQKRRDAANKAVATRQKRKAVKASVDNFRSPRSFDIT